MGCWNHYLHFVGSSSNVTFRLCGFTPFYAETHKELFEKILHSPFEFPDPEWTDISNDGTSYVNVHFLAAKDFIGKLLQKEPEKRITADQALKHPWLLVTFQVLLSILGQCAYK